MSTSGGERLQPIPDNVNNLQGLLQDLVSLVEACKSYSPESDDPDAGSEPDGDWERWGTSEELLMRTRRLQRRISQCLHEVDLHQRWISQYQRVFLLCHSTLIDFQLSMPDYIPSIFGQCTTSMFTNAIKSNTAYRIEGDGLIDPVERLGRMVDSVTGSAPVEHERFLPTSLDMPSTTSTMYENGALDITGSLGAHGNASDIPGQPGQRGTQSVIDANKQPTTGTSSNNPVHPDADDYPQQRPPDPRVRDLMLPELENSDLFPDAHDFRGYDQWNMSGVQT